MGKWVKSYNKKGEESAKYKLFDYIDKSLNMQKCKPNALQRRKEHETMGTE